MLERNPEAAGLSNKLPSIGKAADRVRVSSNLGGMENYMSSVDLPTQRRLGF